MNIQRGGRGGGRGGKRSSHESKSEGKIDEGKIDVPMEEDCMDEKSNDVNATSMSKKRKVITSDGEDEAAGIFVDPQIWVLKNYSINSKQQLNLTF